jgi:hypothetical protein
MASNFSQFWLCINFNYYRMYLYSEEESSNDVRASESLPQDVKFSQLPTARKQVHQVL